MYYWGDVPYMLDDRTILSDSPSRNVIVVSYGLQIFLNLVVVSSLGESSIFGTINDSFTAHYYSPFGKGETNGVEYFAFLV